MEKGARLTTLFQSVEKLTSRETTLVSSFTAEDYHQLRYLTSRILQYVSTQEKCNRDVVLKNTDYLDRLLCLLETGGKSYLLGTVHSLNFTLTALSRAFHAGFIHFSSVHSRDKVTTLNLVYILTEVVGRINNSKRLLLLVAHGATQVLLHVLIFEAKQTDCSEDLLISLHQLISKVGPKDRKFCVKARLHQALAVSLNLLRQYNTHPRILLPITHVLKLYSADAVNVSYLGKNGAVTYLFKVFPLCQRKHLLLLKYALETLSLLVKSKSNAARAVGQGGVSVLLGMFNEWHKQDTKNRHVAIRKAILSVIKNLTNIKSGCQAVVEADGVRVLYLACQETIDCREVESLIYMASIIMRKCFPRNHLPLLSLKNPLAFRIPVDDLLENSDSADPVQGEEIGYESSLDNDDDMSSDDDPEVRKVDSDDDGETDLSYDKSYQRSWDDLNMYKSFFSELYEYDALIELDSTFNTSNMSSSSALNSRTTNPTCRSSVDLRKVSNSMVTIRLDEPSLREPHQFLSESVQESQMTALKHGLSRLSVPDSFHSESDRLSNGKDAKSWSIPSIYVGDASPKTLKKTLAHPRSPKAKRKNSTKMTAVGKQKEKKSAKSKKSAIDEWLSFDLSVVMSTLTSSEAYGEDCLQESRFDSMASDDDDPWMLINGEGAMQQKVDDPELYVELATHTTSVGVFNKLTYPELYGHCIPHFKELLFEKKLGMQRQMIFEDIDRFINPEQIVDRVVYDLDAIVARSAENTKPNFRNDDELRVSGKECHLSDVLMFNSQFESGNLRKAVQVRQYEYDLILNPDVNTNHFHQWFYFEVSNMEANVPYRFNLINCEKMNSQFNFGMRPVMFSVADAMRGRPYWFRAGTKICYYKNHFVRSSQTTGGIRGKTYYTTCFTITFRNEKDVCYIAYHYPYTYTTLQYHLKKWEKTCNTADIYFRNQVLCETVGGNSVPVLTITSHPTSYDRDGISQMKNRPYMFLTSRVHPGESNASWVMKGTIEFLMSDHPTAKSLRDTYIFKVVPMLNPDGVINGNHRCSLVAEDLNRRWFHPCPKRHPTIYHTKGLLQYLTALDKAPLVFCDYHGHSRRKNVFLYGCSPSLSWIADDFDNPGILPNQTEDIGYKTLPKLLQSVAPAFSLSNCSFVVEKVKETTARVVVWRQMRVLRSYTMESTYCGCDQGLYRGRHINIRHLETMGQKFVEALAKLKVKHPRSSIGSPSAPVSDGTDDTVAFHRLVGASAESASTNQRDSCGSLGSTSSDVEEDLGSDEQERDELDAEGEELDLLQ